MSKVIYKIRCNMCGAHFEDDDYLTKDLYDSENDEYFNGCGVCGTDEYLMDLDFEDGEEKISVKVEKDGEV